MPPIWNALIRTHHITSRKKVAKLRQAASNLDVYALLRSGGSPGIMYCEGAEAGVKDWVAAVNRLRYKDFQLATKPAVMEGAELDLSASNRRTEPGKLEEVGTVKEFGARMEALHIWKWWRKSMGYAHED
jgi:hypothetical protein